MTQGLNILGLPAVVRSLQIVVFAMMAGVVAFSIVALLMGKPADGTPLLTYVAAGATAAAIVTRLVVPRIYISHAVERLAAPTDLAARGEGPTEQQLANVFSTATILGVALLEGAAFFNLVAYLLEAQLLSLLIVGMLLLAMGLHFPLLGSVTAWVRQREREIADLRQLPRG